MASLVTAVGKESDLSATVFDKMTSAGVCWGALGNSAGASVDALAGSACCDCLRFAGGVSSTPEACNLHLAHSSSSLTSSVALATGARCFSFRKISEKRAP